MSLQDSNVDVGVDLEAGQDEGGQAGLAIGADDFDDHDTHRVLCAKFACVPCTKFGLSKILIFVI